MNITADQIRSTIIPKSDRLNADQLIVGPMDITLTDVNYGMDEKQNPIFVLHYENEAGRPFKPCKTCRKVLIFAWGEDGRKWVGKSMTLFNDPNVKFGGMSVGGIRISHMSGLTGPKQMALTETRAKRTPYTVQPLKDAPAPKQEGDPAKDWADKFVVNVGRAPDREKLEAYIAKVKVNLRLEADVLKFFKSMGPEHSGRINDVLRSFIK